MKLIINIPEDVYTRLFDNGIQDNEIAVDDVCEMARALRMGIPYEERPQGEWIENSLTIEKTLNCSICGARPRQSVYGYYLHDNFCPNCGAEMRRGDTE